MGQTLPQGQQIGGSPVAFAVLSAPELLSLILEKRANPNGKNQLGKTALIQATMNGDLKSVKLLISYKADIELDDGKFSPLATAVRSNHPEIVKYLLEKGANPNGKGNPLKFAKDLQNTELISALQKAGAKQ